MKKIWQKPELISLARCKPAEAVMATCKWFGGTGDPTLSCGGCLTTTSIPCQNCSGSSES